MQASFLPLLCIGVAFFCGTVPPAEATPLTVTTTANFPTTFTAFTDDPNQQSVAFANAGKATAMINPFNAALGTLDKVTIRWDFGGSFSGTAGVGPGAVNWSIGGSTYVNLIAYGGGGSGNGNGASAGVAFTATQPNTAINKDFLPSEAGVNYDPGILTAFTGASPYSVTFEASGNYFYYTSVASGTATSYRDVAVTYTYTAVPEIDPATGGSALSLLIGLAAIFDRRQRPSLVARS